MSIIHATFALIGIASLSLSSSLEAVRCAVDLGINAEAMVCAGVSNSDAAQLLAFVDSAEESRLAIENARAAVDAASDALAMTESSLALEPDNQSLVEARDSALAAFQSTTVTLGTARQSMFALATSLLPPEDAASLAVVIAGASRRVPDEFRVVSRSEAEWTAIELALRAEVRAIREGSAVPAECASLLAAVRADSAVNEAKERLASELGSMKAMFIAQ